jgi:tight adherence protein C
MSAHLAWAVTAGVILGLGLWSVASAAPRLSRPRLARRIAPHLLDVSAPARELLAPAPPGPLAVLGVVVGPSFVRASRILGSALGGSAQVALRLRQSASGLTVERFRSQQLMLGVAGATIGLALGVAGQSPFAVLFAAVLAAGGVVLRDYLLKRAAAKRLQRLAEELPVILEFLTLSLSAGESIVDALRRVSRIGAGELSRELSDVVAAVGTGLPFGETLATLARELHLTPLTRCVEQIVGALDRGSPLAEVLRAQAQDARDDAKRQLLETAGRKEIAMLFPLVFLILPVTIVFAIFPGVLVLEVGL